MVCLTDSIRTSQGALFTITGVNSSYHERSNFRTIESDRYLNRRFSTSRCLLKKGAKAARDEKKASGNAPESDNPYDFSTLEGDIATAVERLKNDLSKLRAGGRFNPEVLEDLRVQPDKKISQTFKLNDLAQVIPKGRTVQILIGEQEVS